MERLLDKSSGCARGHGLAVMFCLGLLASACGTDAVQPVTYALPSADAGFDSHAAGKADGTGLDSGALPDAQADTADQDAATPDAAADDGASPDVPPTNNPPQLLAIPPIVLNQGAWTTVDLNPLLADAESPDGALVLSWSGKHVALKDPGSHVLYIVAPTTWFGSEQIALTVKDPDGLTASATLHVTVTEVVVAKPVPVEDCGKVLFSIAAGKGQHVVLLSGSFNGWASTQDKADVLTDAAGSGVWSLEKALPTGVYQYKFVVDGKWMADAANPNQTADGFGGKNSVIEVAACKP